jgi:hypothetical protein
MKLVAIDNNAINGFLFLMNESTAMMMVTLIKGNIKNQDVKIEIMIDVIVKSRKKVGKKFMI